MAVYTGEFRDLEAVAALTVATVAEADDPAILERLVSALVAAGFEQEDAWAPLSLEKMTFMKGMVSERMADLEE